MTDNYIPIDVELYEKLVIIGMRQGHDNPLKIFSSCTLYQAHGN
jgi:hypothetical protein